MKTRTGRLKLGLKKLLNAEQKEVFNICGKYNTGSQLNQRTANEIKDLVKSFQKRQC